MGKHILFFAMIVSVLDTYSQEIKPRTPIPARGHYRQLAAFSPTPQAINSEWDEKKFPFDSASAAKRLSTKPVYLQKVKVSDFNVPPPPANSSEQTRAELNYLLSLQTKRTKLEIESSLFMAGVFYNPKTTPADSNYQTYRKNLFFIGRSIGTWFHPDTLPQTTNLMANVWQDASYFIWALKYQHLRVRPYVLDSRLENLEETNWAAYPSGHAANSYINAFIYMELAPEFSDVFLKDAYDMAHSREIIGVHYPSDSEASRLFARQFVNRLFENEDFRKDFEKARQEWKHEAKESLVAPTTKIAAPAKKAAACASTCHE